jgi:hypothetical protein
VARFSVVPSLNQDASVKRAARYNGLQRWKRKLRRPYVAPVTKNPPCLDTINLWPPTGAPGPYRASKDCKYDISVSKSMKIRLGGSDGMREMKNIDVPGRVFSTPFSDSAFSFAGPHLLSAAVQGNPLCRHDLQGSSRLSSLNLH